MAKNHFTYGDNCFKKGDAVTWHYRSAIGHGTVEGVHRQGKHCADTLYSVREHDHHDGEHAVVYHTGKALRHAD